MTYWKNSSEPLKITEALEKHLHVWTLLPIKSYLFNHHVRFLHLFIAQTPGRKLTKRPTETPGMETYARSENYVPPPAPGFQPSMHANINYPPQPGPTPTCKLFIVVILLFTQYGPLYHLKR